jgi:uncharacterized membrane protein YccF (DUF307 family)
MPHGIVVIIFAVTGNLYKDHRNKNYFYYTYLLKRVMKFLGNIIWLIFGGIFIFLEYIVAGVVLCITIIGIPFGIQSFKLGMLALWPFGQKIEYMDYAPGCLSTMMNLIWLIIGGIWIALTHLLFGVLLGITIIGIPWAKQHFKMVSLALTPFGRKLV